MKNKFLAVFVFALVLSAYAAFAASPYFFKGIAHVNGSLAPNGTVIEAFVPGNATTSVSSVTIGEGQLAGLDPGKYVISFEANPGDTVSFKINGVALIAANETSNVTQNLTASPIISNFNLSINKSANAAACTFAAGCTGGFCVHSLCRSASTFCGDGFCDSGESCSSDDSACSSGQACTNGCVATTTTTTTTSGGGGGGPAAPSTTENVGAIEAGATKSVAITQTALPVSEIELTAKETIAGVSVTVKEVSKPAEATVAISSTTGAVYKYLDISQSGGGTSIEKAKIKFKVPKSWINTNKIGISTVALNRLVGSTWTKLPTTKLSEDATNVYYEATTSGFSTFAVTGEKAATFFDVVSKIDQYYQGKATFFEIIDLIDLYYKTQ